MKAAMWYARKDVRVVETEEPKALPGMVKIKVKWCGICGSDLHEFLGGPIFIPTEQPHPLSGESAPVIMGHELSGEVVEIGGSQSDRPILKLDRQPLIWEPVP